MEFWGVEVKPGETVKCDPGEDKYLHLSQAAVGEAKKDKGTENVTIFVKFNDQKLVLGTLSADKCAQISYDLVFEQEFEISHSSKHASVCFCGYKTISHEPYDSEDDFSDSESEFEEDVQIGAQANGKPEVKGAQVKPETGKAKAENLDASSAKSKAKKGESVKPVMPKVKNEDDEDEESEEDESDDDEDMADAMGDSDDEDESSEEEDETPEKAGIAKKRPAESASKTPVPEKKAKVVTPSGGQKTGDGKKSGHTATPHPAKQAGKMPANSNKSKQQSPKSGGSVSCKSCSKSFNSENALQAHTKAKHSDGK